MFDSIYNNCDPSPKEISCLCGEVVFRMSNGRPSAVIECCCVDCYQHLEWASVNGGPQAPIIPTLSYWDNDLVVEKGEDLLQVVLLREDGRSHRLVSTCCHSTLMVDHPSYNGVMFMLFEESCRIQWDDMQKSPSETRPAESRIYTNDFDISRGKLPEFNGDPEQIHQTCSPYVDKWNSQTSPTLENPKGETCQTLFERVPKIILGLEEGKRIFNLSDCPTGSH